MKKFIISTLVLSSAVAFADPALTVKSAGRAPEAKLKVKTSKVPTYSLVTSKGGKMKQIPKLDIGEEARISAAIDIAPVSLPAAQEYQLKPIRKNSSPELVSAPSLKDLLPVTKSKIVTTTQAIERIPEVKGLATVADPKTKDADPSLAAIKVMTPNDYKLLQALIFLQVQNNYELAMGLFAELIEDPKHRTEALYQYALTAKGLNLNSEFREYMLRAAKDDSKKEWKTRATQQLAENIGILETSDIKFIEPLVLQTDIDTTQNALYQLTKAKYFLNEGQLTQVDDALMLIPENSEHYNEALLTSGIFNYRRGKLDDSIMDLEKLLRISDKTWKSRSVAAITLARMYFQKSQYKEAFQNYLQVDKSDPLWMQAMVEQAWTQILSEDYEGAAGNMFSLHTDFFKNAFSPESYVVRTVGYLNLCQFGDGNQVLGEMKKKYAPWKVKMESYKQTHTENLAYYDTVKMWLKNSDLKEVDGLPRSFIVELARHPGFTKVQGQINNYEDEIVKFNKIAISLIRMGKDISQKQTEVIKTAKTAIERERLLGPLKIQEYIAKKAVTSIKALRNKGVARLEKEKTELRGVASLALQKRFKELYSSLDRVLGQNDVLQYEMYSGAGEHIRYQMAGGDVNDKKRDELKVQDGKSLHWKTKGEVWEDEVGHYRSSLKNVCAKETVAGG